MIVATVVAAPSVSTSPATTRAPAVASATALARPRPEPAPVTIATFPSSCIPAPMLRPGRSVVVEWRPCAPPSPAGRLRITPPTRPGAAICCRRISGPRLGGDPELGDVDRAAPVGGRHRDGAGPRHPEPLGHADR